jgi:hypothetical protein
LEESQLSPANRLGRTFAGVRVRGSEDVEVTIASYRDALEHYERPSRRVCVSICDFVVLVRQVNLAFTW